uniref:Uncharacterized protein n=1 Tax=Oryza rufipogon TaxID=4529 RepID=A0A0E0RBS4_ORYRU
MEWPPVMACRATPPPLATAVVSAEGGRRGWKEPPPLPPNPFSATESTRGRHRRPICGGRKARGGGGSHRHRLLHPPDLAREEGEKGRRAADSVPRGRAPPVELVEDG